MRKILAGLGAAGGRDGEEALNILCSSLPSLSLLLSISASLLSLSLSSSQDGAFIRSANLKHLFWAYLERERGLQHRLQGTQLSSHERELCLALTVQFGTCMHT